ncbi:hypothetical protein M2244_004233, partial [Rhodoferax antarcticus]|nr:hypothetical protein [Rhodoferax antarcticus]
MLIFDSKVTPQTCQDGPGSMPLKFDTVFPNSWFSRPGLPMNSTTYVDFLVES